MERTYTIIEEGNEHQISLREIEEGYELRLGETTHRFRTLAESATLYSFLIDESHVMEADFSFNQDKCQLYIQNIPYQLEVFDPRRRKVSQSEAAGGGGLIAAPMPGKIVEVKVQPGDMVEAGQAVIVIEAMKMQNELNSPLAGKVEEVSVKAGDAVESDQKLVLIKAPAKDEK